MGSDLSISAGSLLWTWAGSGVTHHGFPDKEGDKIHGLQLFLEIPVETRNQPPKGLLVPVEEMPVKDADGVRIKVVLGAAAGMVNYIKTPEDITFLDLQMATGKPFQHTLPRRWNGTVYVQSGTLTLATPNGNLTLTANDTVALGPSAKDSSVTFQAKADSHLLFISGLPLAQV
jgi:redox-sensitive bicupin YhaK (pirin superfamily)